MAKRHNNQQPLDTIVTLRNIKDLIRMNPDWVSSTALMGILALNSVGLMKMTRRAKILAMSESDYYD